MSFTVRRGTNFKMGADLLIDTTNAPCSPVERQSARAGMWIGDGGMWIGAWGFVDRCMGLVSVEQDGMGSSVERSGAEEHTACQTTGSPSIQ